VSLRARHLRRQGFKVRPGTPGQRDKAGARLVLGLTQRGHELQVLADGMSGAQCGQPLRARQVKSRGLSQSQARDGALGERLNLRGI